MLQALVTFSLRFRGIIIALACIALVYGVYVAEHARFDVFPDFVQPQVAIQTECPGLSPEQVELLVTVPLETRVTGLTDLESLRSESIEGLSIITAVFKEGADVFRARQMLAEQLAETTPELPVFVKPPRLTPLTSSTMDLLKIGLVSDKLTPMELRTYADWSLKPRLLAIPGVAKCSSFGGEVRQLQIQVLPDRLMAYGLGISDVLAAARLSTGVRGAGFFETANQRITLQSEGELRTPEQLGEIVLIHTNAFSVRLKDVARIAEGPAPKFGDTVIQGRSGVLMTMSSQFGANTLEVTRSLEAALEELKPLFAEQGIQIYPRLHRPATFIEASLRNMAHSLLLGAILVAVVLVLLAGSVRSALISLTAIPLSLLTAVVVLQKFGITINTITLGGLAIALGEVVDDSIIDVENILRRLREHQALAKAGTPGGKTIFETVLGASLEVRSAVVYATFIVALIFLPVLTLSGLQGSFFAPLALSYILAIMASLLVALTLTPALAYLLFRKGPGSSAEPRLQTRLKAGYRRLLGWGMRRPKMLLVVVLIATLAAVIRLPFFGGDLLPEFKEGHFVVQLIAAPGTSMPEMLRLGTRISQELLNNTNIDTVEQQVGRAELGEDPWGPHRSELHIELKTTHSEEQEQVKTAIEETLKKFPGLQFEVLTFLGDRISETISGETEAVVVNIFGEDLDRLDAKAREVAAVLNGVPGHASVKVKAPPGAPRMVARLRLDRLAQFGFRPVEVLEAVEAAFQGTIVAQTHRGSEIIDVAVILDPRSREVPESLGSVMLRSSQGALLPLRELADVFPARGRFSILHEGARRRQTVTCSTRGRDVSSFVEEAKKQVAARVKFPEKTYAVFSGTAQAREKAQRELLLNSGMAAIGILLLLSVAFHNRRNLLLVLANVPFALVGGVLAAWLSSALGGGGTGRLSICSLVGFVTLFGITTRNSIMLVSHFEHLVRQEGMSWGWEAALRGASERLMPILMTAIITGLGLLPLALGSGESGRELEGPIAIIILGGLITSTVLNLLVLPSLALKYGRFEVGTD
jgi:CzcA family heavy metal efflux pump